MIVDGLFRRSSEPELMMEVRMPPELEEMLAAARRVPMSSWDKEMQRRSFAYGNAHIENARATREMIDEAADRIQHDDGRRP